MKYIIFIIDDVQIKNNATTTILNKINEDLDKLKQNSNSMMISYHKSNELEVQYTKDLR